MAKILVVEDEPAIAESVAYALGKADHETLVAASLKEARQSLTADTELVVLDLMLPGIDGYEVCRRLRQNPDMQFSKIILVSAKSLVSERLQGYEVGADDYITKPFAPRELIARIKALLRRSGVGESADRMQVSELVLDGKSRRVYLADEPLDMGPTEFNLLQFFMSHPERAYSRNQMLDQVWGANVYVEERTVDVHIRRLRKALQVDGKDYSGLIQTVRGTGYRFSSRGVPAG